MCKVHDLCHDLTAIREEVRYPSHWSFRTLRGSPDQVGSDLNSTEGYYDKTNDAIDNSNNLLFQEYIAYATQHFLPLEENEVWAIKLLVIL